MGTHLNRLGEAVLTSTQSMFLSRNKNNNAYPCKPQFYYIKVGFKGVNIIWACFRDEDHLWQLSAGMLRRSSKALYFNVPRTSCGILSECLTGSHVPLRYSITNSTCQTLPECKDDSFVTML